MELIGKRAFLWLRVAHRERLHIITCLLVGWALWIEQTAVRGAHGWLGNAVFILAAVCLSVIFLRLLHGFDRLGFMPSLSDLLVLLLATAGAGLLAYAALNLFASLSWCGKSSCDITTLLLSAAYAASFTYFADLLFSAGLVRGGGRKKIVLDVLPEQRASLIEDFVAAGLHPQLTYLSRADLIDELKESGGPDLDHVVISRDGAAAFDRDAVLIRAHLAGIPIWDACKLSARITGRIKLPQTDQWSFLQHALPQTLSIRVFHACKSFFEPLLAVLMLIVFAPMIAVIAAAVRMSAPGPIFYRQRRLGYLNKPFTLIKFRTMRVDAETQGPQWSETNDPRITPIGRFLRRTRLDELPQLLNIAKGEMSFVGPRPERPEIYATLQEAIPLFPLRTVVRPGITGWAQIKAGYAASVRESHKKLEYDLYYVQHMSPLLDCRVILHTVVIALIGERNERQARRAALRKAALGKAALSKAAAAASTDVPYAE